MTETFVSYVAQQSSSNQTSSSPHIISSLFLQDYSEDIILSTRTRQNIPSQNKPSQNKPSLKTEFYRIMNIKRYVLVAKLPSIDDSTFLDLVEEWLRQSNLKDCKVDRTPIMMYDSNISLLGNKWTYYKIEGSKRDLNQLTKVNKPVRSKKPKQSKEQENETETEESTDYEESKEQEEPKTLKQQPNGIKDSDKSKKEQITITFKYDNYLVPDFTPQTKKTVVVSKFCKLYYEKLMSLENLTGIDKLIQPYLRYPFRQVGQDYLSIQYKYKINFFNPLIINNIKHSVENPTKYRADVIHYVDIADIENIPTDTSTNTNIYANNTSTINNKPIYDVEQIVQDQMENYCSIMFDIENYVFIPSYSDNDKNSSTKHKKQDTYHLITQSQKNFSELSNNYYQTFNKNGENKYKFSDQEQITSISFIEQNFKSQILKKYCVMNIGDHYTCKSQNGSQFNDIYSENGVLLYTNEQIKDKINKGYEEDTDNTNNTTANNIANNSAINHKYADEVYVYDNERDLLVKTIEILTSTKYHIVQHFNGWKFDEPMLCIRLLLYNLLDRYIQQMCPIYSQSYDVIKNTLPNDAKYKQSAQTIETHLTQLKSPLKFSLDVYQLNLHDDVGAQKHDGGNSLNSLLKYHNLGLKGDISYQQICDAFENHDTETLIKAAWYCQRDSVQQARLQQKLRIILNHIQFSRLCQISLKDSVQKAVGTKVVSTAYNYYANNNVAFQDVLMPYQNPQTITIVVSGKTKKHKVTNIGGEVECFLPGFNKCISAVDAASMYPAQIEANNISNNCMLYPYQMDDILENPTKYGIKDIKLTYLLDLYSPYTYEQFVKGTTTMENFITNYQNLHGEIPTINMLNYVISLPQHKKEKRLRIELVYDNLPQKSMQCKTDNNCKTADMCKTDNMQRTANLDSVIYEQFYFDKKDITNMNKFVWYIQGKNPETNKPWSPRSNLLTTFRFLRKGVKKQIKEATDPDLKAFYDGKQGAIKVCMNSLYGTTDTTNYALFENIGAAIITRCSKCEIRNCRDNIQATGYQAINTFYVQPRHKFNELKELIRQYNTLCRTFFKDPSQTLIYVSNNTLPDNTPNDSNTDASNTSSNIDQHNIQKVYTNEVQFIKFPKLSMKYQDTDSNYFIMDVLDKLEMKNEEEIRQTIQQDNLQMELLQECYIKPHILGLFNLIFSSYINNSMNKFPLEFSFEGAFYRAWHIGKKQYLGQKVPQFTIDCKFNENNTKLTQINPLKGVHITNHIQLSDYDPDNDDIYVFIASRHLKVTGIKIVKRDATLLTKKYYMKFIEQVLNNEETHNQEFMLNTIASLINEIKDDFQNKKITLKQISISKKISSNDIKKSTALQQYNELHPSQKLGLGEMFYKYVHLIENQNPLVFQLSGFSVVAQTIATTEDQLNLPADDAYVGYYLLQVAKSLISFEMLYEDDNDDSVAITKNAHALLLDRNIIQKPSKNYRLKDIDEGLDILKCIAISKTPKCKCFFYKPTNKNDNQNDNQNDTQNDSQQETQKVIVETLINGLTKKKPLMTSKQKNSFEAWLQIITTSK